MHNQVKKKQNRVIPAVEKDDLLKIIEEPVLDGVLTEDDLIIYLENIANIVRSDKLDTKYKLDFIIEKFKNVDKLINIGVQVTRYLNKYDKMIEFKMVREKASFVDRSIYIEIEPSVNMKEWGNTAITYAIQEFAFNKKWRNQNIIGLRISDNYTYSFFDITERINLLVDTSYKNGDLNFVDNVTYEGFIIKYFSEKGFGFIWGNNDETKYSSIFFHISNIQDEKVYNALSEKLNSSNGLKVIKVKYRLLYPIIQSSSSKRQALIIDLE